MYDYIQVRIDAYPCDETLTDLLAAFLADAEFVYMKVKILCLTLNSNEIMEPIIER